MSDKITVMKRKTMTAAMDEGRAHHSAERLPEAEAIYRGVLEAEHDNADALHLLGVIAHHRKNNELSVKYVTQAIAAKPAIADYHITLGIAFSAQGMANEAVAAFKRGAELNPDDAEAHYNLGIAWQAVGKNADAVACHRRAVALKPDLAEAHYSLGNTLKNEGMLDDAVIAYHRVLALRPDDGEAYNNLGNTLRKLGKLDDAEAALASALKLAPDIAVMHNNLGAVLLDRGNLDGAVREFRKALALKPGYAQAHDNLGNALKDQGKLDAAVAAFHKALEIRPDYSLAHNNLATALMDQGKLEDAVGACRRALELDPDSTVAHGNLGAALMDQGRLAAAMTSFRRAIEIDPAFDQAHSNLLFSLPYDARTTAAELFFEHRRWADLHEAQVTKLPEIPAADDAERPLRIGFVSPDFHTHPVGFFLEPVLSHHDRSRFEMVCYANATKTDDVTTRLRHSASEWREIFGFNDDDFAALVRRDRIDILIELTGHQAENRLLALARRPAPLQVAWMGGVNGRGLSALDYLITDRIHARPGAEEFYMEKLIRMPHGYACYRPPDYAPALQAPPAQRSGRLTFGCFNNISKINDRVIALWAEILHAVPDARLLVKTVALDDRPTRQRLMDKFEAAGVSRQRVELQGRSPHAELLAGYGEVDIALDPFPYSGGLTTCEALWQGVPVITWPGELPQGRHSASHLTHAGLSDSIAASGREYIALAVRWANDIPALTRLRAGLRDRMAKSNLCDGAKFTSDLEGELRKIWRRRCAAGAV